ncbi:MAG: peptidoglycan DD-metalloendopeptidase family protein [Candidatus Kerfeldbacteria bacterium]|nr:peptidoglycan DD-metalloendopeptidase family protein [Candidatus Kerfeldbacteria bacterium]
MIYSRRTIFLSILLIGVATCALLFVIPAYADEIDDQVQAEIDKDDHINELNKEITDKSAEVQDIAERLHVYQEQVDQKQQEERTLLNEITVIDDQTEETNIQIEKTQKEIELTQTQIELASQQIHIAEEDLTKNKSTLTQLIREMNTQEQQTPIEIMFSEHTFSGFYNQLEYTNRIQNDIHDTVQSLRTVKKELEAHRTELKEKKAQAALQKTNLGIQQEELSAQKTYKDTLLDTTQESEEKFSQLLEDARAEHARVEAEVNQLEQSAQDKIRKIREGIEQKLNSDEAQEDLTESEETLLDHYAGNFSFQWPSESHYITCFFGCITPYSDKWGPHSGIDIAMQQGSPVYAAESGYVTIARFDPNSAGLALIVIDHGGPEDQELNSRYLHVSGINVSPDQYVRRGQLIGWSGGFPGTPGSGDSTGSHLHFEIRVAGITAVDPLLYLP